MVARSGLLAFFVAFVALSTYNVHGRPQSTTTDSDDDSSPFTVQYLNRTSKTDHPGLVGFTLDGDLQKFGHIAGDGTFNYDADKGYGNGFNIGVTDLKNTSKSIAGIGGGSSFNQTNVNVGAGISAFDQKVNFNLNIAKGGIVTANFDLSGDSANTLNCTPFDENGRKGITCTTAVSK